MERLRQEIALVKLEVDETLCFLSHHKGAAGKDARLLKSRLCAALNIPQDRVFLDSDQTGLNLNELLEHLRKTKVVILLQTSQTLLRPYVIAEIVAAIKLEIPIIPVLIRDGGYDFSKMVEYLSAQDFRERLDKDNPGSVDVLERQGIDIQEAGSVLQAHIPQIISIELDMNASEKRILVAIEEIVEALTTAITTSKKSASVKPLTKDKRVEIFAKLAFKREIILNKGEQIALFGDGILKVSPVVNGCLNRWEYVETNLEFFECCPLPLLCLSFPVIWPLDCISCLARSAIQCSGAALLPICRNLCPRALPAFNPNMVNVELRSVSDGKIIKTFTCKAGISFHNRILDLPAVFAVGNYNVELKKIPEYPFQKFELKKPSEVWPTTTQEELMIFDAQGNRLRWNLSTLEECAPSGEADMMRDKAKIVHRIPGVSLLGEKDTLVQVHYYSRTYILRGHEGTIQDWIFDETLRNLATSADDGTIRVWDWESERQIACLKVANVSEFHFLPGSLILFTKRKSDNYILLWEIATSTIINKLQFRGFPGDYRFSLDRGRLLVWDIMKAYRGDSHKLRSVFIYEIQ